MSHVLHGFGWRTMIEEEPQGDCGVPCPGERSGGPGAACMLTPCLPSPSIIPTPTSWYGSGGGGGGDSTAAASCIMLLLLPLLSPRLEPTRSLLLATVKLTKKLNPAPTLTPNYTSAVGISKTTSTSVWLTPLTMPNGFPGCSGVGWVRLSSGGDCRSATSSGSGVKTS